MQPLRFVRTLVTVVEELEVGPLLNFLARFLNSTLSQNTQIAQADKDAFAQLLFSSRSGFDDLNRDPSTKAMLKSLGIESIYDPARLGKLLSSFGAAQNIAGIHAQGVFTEFAAFQQMLVALANLQGTCSFFLETERLGEDNKRDELLELQLVSFDKEGITPDRLVQFLNLVNRLHTDLARVLGVSGDRLHIIYLESGSDDIFGFKCIKEIAVVIKEFIFEVWEKIKYSGFEEFEKKSEAIETGLNTMALVDAAVTKNTVTAEEGMVLKKHLLRNVKDLIGLGASLPSNQEFEMVDQRKLLIDKRSTKLLGDGGQTSSNNTTASNEDR